VPATTEVLDDDQARRLAEVGTHDCNLIVGNYLTTLGRAPQELVMLDNRRMPIGTLSKAN
jgi:hypothetical protein